jgi:hypothetical protein
LSLRVLRRLLNEGVAGCTNIDGVALRMESMESHRRCFTAAQESEYAQQVLDALLATPRALLKPKRFAALGGQQAAAAAAATAYTAWAQALAV